MHVEGEERYKYGAGDEGSQQPEKWSPEVQSFVVSEFDAIVW